MGFNTYPVNPFPPSTDQMYADKLEALVILLDNIVNGDATTYPYADVITIEDAVPANLAGCNVKIEPVQSGSGDPSPTNVRPITGHTEVSVEVTDGDETTKTYTIALRDTIYGGTVDFNTGLMTVTHGYIDISSLSWSYNTTWTVPGWRATLSGVEISESDLSVPDMMADTFPTLSVNDIINDGKYGISVSNSSARLICNNGSSEVHPTGNVAYPLAAPTTVQLTPQQIQLLQGQNTLTASTGNISVTVNGVSGAIGQVQEQVNATDEALAELAEKLPTAPTTDGEYVLTVTVADGTPTYSWESAT